jgi:hypothetical protein
MFDHLSPAQARQILGQIRPLLAQLIPLLGQSFDIAQDLENPCVDDPNGSNCSQFLQAQIAEYGITINRYANFSIEQLQSILNAIMKVADRLADELTGCPCYTGSVLMPQEVFTRVYGTYPLELRYQPLENRLEPPVAEGRTYASVDRSDENVQYLTLVPDTFSSDPDDPNRTNPNSERQPYDSAIIERIIIHELGHAFHNNLSRVQGDPLEYEFDNPDVQIEERTNFRGQRTHVIVTIPTITVDGTTYTNLRVTVPANMPMVIMDFLVETGGYYSGTDFDDGSARGALYTSEDASNDPTIVLLTNLIYEKYSGLTSCTNENCDEYLVNLNGQCLLSSQGTCLPINDSHPDKRYVRIPQTYKPGTYSDSVLSPNVFNYFINEQGETSVSHPQEGFADTFAFHILEGSENIEDDNRGRFFVNNFCDWLCSLVQQE